MKYFLIVPALLNRLFDAQLRNRLGRLLIARSGLFHAPPTGDRLIELAATRKRLRRAAIHRHILRRGIQCPPQRVKLAFIAANLLIRVGDVQESTGFPRIRFERIASRGKCFSPLTFAGGFVKRHPRGFRFQRRESRPLLVVTEFLRQIAQKVLQENQVRRILSQALGQQVVRVFVVGLFGTALGVLEHRLKPLANRGRYRRQSVAIRFAWLLRRHGWKHDRGWKWPVTQTRA